MENIKQALFSRDYTVKYQMSAEDRLLALEIITSSTKCNVSFNVPINDSYTNVDEIVIHSCPPSVVKKLINYGFSCTVSNNGLSISKH